MGRIDQLIAKLCPEGVKHERLGEVLDLVFGERITKSQDAGTTYRVFGGGGASFMTDKWNCEDAFVISRFALSQECVREVKGKFWLLDSGFTFRPLNQNLLTRFVGYIMLSLQPKIFELSAGAAQKNLKLDLFRKIAIPVPPLEVQQEIVKILDAFTKLEAELEAELEARRKQNEHYRRQLLSTGLIAGAPRKSVEEIARSVIPSRSIPKSDYDSGAMVPIIDQSQAFVCGYTDDVEARLDIGECVIFGDHTRALKWVDFAFACGASGTKILQFTDDIFPKFAYHALSDLEIPNRGYNRHWTVLAPMTIPVPALDTQREIAATLDALDALVNDISIGLPAEIAARRKQYEHYRDKLLTFEEAS